MKTQTAFAERAGRLARICGAGEADPDFSLLKAFILDAAMFGRLRGAVVRCAAVAAVHVEQQHGVLVRRILEHSQYLVRRWRLGRIGWRLGRHQGRRRW